MILTKAEEEVGRMILESEGFPILEKFINERAESIRDSVFESTPKNSLEEKEREQSIGASRALKNILGEFRQSIINIS